MVKNKIVELSYNKWKEYVMKETDINKGTKLALRVNDVHVNNLEKISCLESLKGAEFYLAYKTKYVSGVFQIFELKDFGMAQELLVNNEFRASPLSDIPTFVNINEGYHDLIVIIDYNDKNRERLREWSITREIVPMTENYTGLPL